MLFRGCDLREKKSKCQCIFIVMERETFSFSANHLFRVIKLQTLIYLLGPCTVHASQTTNEQVEQTKRKENAWIWTRWWNVFDDSPKSRWITNECVEYITMRLCFCFFYFYFYICHFVSAIIFKYSCHIWDDVTLIMFELFVLLLTLLAEPICLSRSQRFEYVMENIIALWFVRSTWCHIIIIMNHFQLNIFRENRTARLTTNCFLCIFIFVINIILSFIGAEPRKK